MSLVRDGAGRRERLAAARLYVCTPIRPDLGEFADSVLGAGVDLIQLRDKQAEAGRLAHLAGRIPRRLYASASTPTEGLPDLSDRPAEGTREPEGQPRQPEAPAERVG